MQKRQFSFEISPGRTIYGDFRVPEFPDGKPLIIFCHGFKGFKDWGGWQYALDKMCANGFFTIAVNFSHNGIGVDLQNFAELDKFAVNTIGKELEDIKALLDKIDNRELFPEFTDKPRIGLIGHSRGGGTSILFTASDSRIDTLVTWAGVANFDGYLSKGETWRSTGYIEFENARTNQMMRVKVDFLNDLTSNPVERDIRKAQSRHGKPHLILHGDADEAVSIEHPQMLFESSNKTITRMDIIRGGTHTFGTAHQFQGSNDIFDSVINKTIEWFRTYLVK
jgi:dienelactone hydrolase